MTHTQALPLVQSKGQAAALRSTTVLRLFEPTCCSGNTRNWVGKSDSAPYLAQPRFSHACTLTSVHAALARRLWTANRV